jgi:hypothetical protein
VQTQAAIGVAGRGVWQRQCVVLLMASVPIFTTAGVDAEQGLAVGMVTQITAEPGIVEVMPKGSADWRPARPLLALRPGDTIRTTADASVIVIPSGDPHPVKIDSTNSPFIVPPQRPDKARSEKAVVLLRAIFDYLSTNTHDKLAPVLVTRHGRPTLSILSPRAGPILPGPLVFEWSPTRSGSATVTVLSTTGVLLKQTGVTTTTLPYPETSPMLVSGERYRLRVQENPASQLDTWFEIVGTERAEAVHRSLAELQQVIPAEASASSVTVIKAAYLAQQGLFYDARTLLLAGLAQDPREPALHLLLGHVYTETGLPELATESYRTAWLLLAHKESRPSSR